LRRNSFSAPGWAWTTNTGSHESWSSAPSPTAPPETAGQPSASPRRCKFTHIGAPPQPVFTPQSQPAKPTPASKSKAQPPRERALNQIRRPNLSRTGPHRAGVPCSHLGTTTCAPGANDRDCHNLSYNNKLAEQVHPAGGGCRRPLTDPQSPKAPPRERLDNQRPPGYLRHR